MVNNVVSEIRNFHSLKELSESLEEEIVFSKNAVDEYGQRLGSLLRGAETAHGDEDWFKEVSGLQKTAKEGKSKSKGKKKGGGNSGWIQFKDIMISTKERGEAQILFDAIEDINSAAVAATELEYEEIAPWLEWLGEELDAMLRNVLRSAATTVEGTPEG